MFESNWEYVTTMVVQHSKLYTWKNLMAIILFLYQERKCYKWMYCKKSLEMLVIMDKCLNDPCDCISNFE
jgi:hypothetical protein